MEKIKLTTDSTCDLSNELLEKYEIDCAPLIVNLGENAYRDGVDINPEMIYDYYAKTKKLPKTSAPGVETYSEFFKKYTDQGYRVIHFNIGNEMSGSHQMALLAANDNPDVFVVDSTVLSTGTALLILNAYELKKLGKSAKEIYEISCSKAPYVQTSFVVDTLEFLHKGGRCSTIALLGANLLKIRPYIKMENGKLSVFKKYRGGMIKVLAEDYVKELKAMFPNPDKKYAFITHTSCDKAIVDAVKAAVKENFGFENVYETIAGSVITSHCGKGTLGVLFINSEPVIYKKK